MTAGNASGMNDGAAAMIVASEAGGRKTRPASARPHPGDGDSWSGTASNGNWPSAGNEKAAGSIGEEDQRFRLDTAQ